VRFATQPADLRRAWLCDTGCPYDLTARSNLPSDALVHIHPADEPVELETANGLVNVDEQVTLQINGITEQIEAYLMEESPDVLSIGSRCELHGYGFHWEPYSKKPYFVDPDGKRVTLVSVDQCPYLEDDFNCDGGGLLVDTVTKDVAVAAPGRRRSVYDEDDEGPTTGIAGVFDLDEDDGIQWQLHIHEGERSSSSDDDPPPLVDGYNSEQSAGSDSDDVEDEVERPGQRRTVRAVSPDPKAKAKSRPGRPGSAKPENEGEAGAEGSVRAESDSAASGGSETRKQQAKSCFHCFDHRDYNPFCEVCCRSRAQRKPRKKGALAMGERPKKFGQQVTADHFVCKDGSGEGDDYFPKANFAVVVFDRATDWTEVYPKATKSYEDTREALQHFAGTASRVKSLYADNAPELRKAAKKLGWGFPSATPGQPQTNGLAERMVRRVKEGGRANLLQSGLAPTWWPYACAHHCFARNVKLAEGDSAYNKRHGGGHCKALQMPFGLCIDYLPVAAPQDKAPTFEAKTRVGLVVGFHVQPGGKWSGDYLVVDFEALRYVPDLPPSSCRVHRTSEVLNFRPKVLHFPLADF